MCLPLYPKSNSLPACASTQSHLPSIEMVNMSARKMLRIQNAPLATKRNADNAASQLKIRRARCFTARIVTRLSRSPSPLWLAGTLQSTRNVCCKHLARPNA
jgi:hypothetical protein